MSNRIAVSQTVRFEIFKRDKFECQYCGAHPPQVILHLDHILAVANGGSNDLDNLITSCSDCNHGKGVRMLENVPQSLDDRGAEIAEREKQISGYEAICRVKRKRMDRDAKKISEAFTRIHSERELNDKGLRDVKRFLEMLGFDNVLDSMEKAGCKNLINPDSTFRYFCGTCWGKLRQGQQ